MVPTLVGMNPNLNEKKQTLRRILKKFYRTDGANNFVYYYACLKLGAIVNFHNNILKYLDALKIQTKLKRSLL